MSKKYRSRGYLDGGFYMIKNIKSDMIYIGKSRDYIFRIKEHILLSKRNSGIFVDKSMYGKLEDFEFYLIAKYLDLGINFFNRKLEFEIERQLVINYSCSFPRGYNKTYYEHLPVKQGVLELLF